MSENNNSIYITHAGLHGYVYFDNPPCGLHSNSVKHEEENEKEWEREGIVSMERNKYILI